VSAEERLPKLAGWIPLALAMRVGVDYLIT
jgi:hypothetical protein